jgi:hypothetical protein
VQKSLAVSREHFLPSPIPLLSGAPDRRPLFRARDSRMLESAIEGFDLQGIEQLQSSFAKRIGSRAELPSMLDSESDSVDSDTSSIRRFELNRQRSRIHFLLDSFKNLMHDFRTHISPPR